MAPSLPSHLRHLVIVLGDQLDPKSSALAGFDVRHDAVWMAEVAEECIHAWSHKARIAVSLAAMRHCRDATRERGVPVLYRQLGDPDNLGSLARELEATVRSVKESAAFQAWRFPPLFRVKGLSDPLADALNGGPRMQPAPTPDLGSGDLRYEVRGLVHRHPRACFASMKMNTTQSTKSLPEETSPSGAERPDEGRRTWVMWVGRRTTARGGRTWTSRGIRRTDAPRASCSNAAMGRISARPVATSRPAPAQVPFHLVEL